MQQSLTLNNSKTCTVSVSNFIANQFFTGIQSTNDYYPFGSAMPGRNFDSDKYKFGFNGKEDDKEITGWQNYGMREYDTRICRFVSIDPLTKKYAMLTPFQFASNSPIMGIDLDGKEILVAIDGTTSKPEFGHTTLIVPDYKKTIKNGVASYQIQGINVYGTPYTTSESDEDIVLNNNNLIKTDYIPAAKIKDYFIETLKNYDGIVQLTNTELSLSEVYDNYLVSGKKSFSEEQLINEQKMNPEAIFSFATSHDMAKRKFAVSNETNKKGDFENTINCAGFVGKALKGLLGYNDNLGVIEIPNSDGSGGMHKAHSPNQLFYDLLKIGGVPRRENTKNLEEYRKSK